MEKKTFYITTPIYYPTGNPHIGTIYTNIISDVLARWHKQKGEDVFFTTGTDEHAQKMEKIAKRKGISTQSYVDQMAKPFSDAFRKFNINFDKFVRTTDKEHVEYCKELIQKLYDQGDIYLGKYEGWYCDSCETYYTEKDLVDGKCPLHDKKAKWMKEEAYFFKMSKYQDRVAEYIVKNNYIFPDSRQNYILGRMNEGVKDLCISRENTGWGIPLPFDSKQVAWVWFDALPNYLSSTVNSENKRFWPADVHVIAHDILWHHSVIWLSMIFAADLEPPKKLLVHGFINAEDGKKMSKSLGNVINPFDLTSSYDIDTIRYYLIREIPVGSDGNFSIKALVDRHNQELMNDLGNLMSRTHTLITKNFEGRIPVSKKDELLKKLDFKKIDCLMLDLQTHNALSEIWKFVNECNRYVNDNKPWELKDDKERLSEILYNLAEALRVISILIYPFMPETAENITKQLGMKEVQKFDKLEFGILSDNQLGKKEYLFTKIEMEDEEMTSEDKTQLLEPDNYIPFNQWEKMDFRVGRIVKVKPHPKADKLYVILVSVGPLQEDRQVVAGLREFYKPEDLIGKQVIIFTNLQPAVIRGVESNGMLLAAEFKNQVSLLGPDKEFQEGAKIL